jgi:hypothetical protein
MGTMVDQIKKSIDFYFSLDALTKDFKENDKLNYLLEEYEDFICRDFEPITQNLKEDEEEQDLSTIGVYKSHNVKCGSEYKTRPVFVSFKTVKLPESTK